MGWNSWNTFQTKISSQLVHDIVDVIIKSGMKEAGYQYIVLDDGWMSHQRDSSGNLVADPEKFPEGMKALADYVHSKGLKFGLYNCAGTQTCAGYPGTRGHEFQDARLYASWGIDYLKFDWCYTKGMNQQEAYTTMSKALKAAGRPMIFSLCEWGTSKPWLWAAPVGQLWRTTGDIGPNFKSVLSIIHLQDTLNRYAGPGHWNDPDMLEVGNGMSTAEDRSHFSMWCMLAAPLMAGNDLRSMKPEARTILTNKEVIALDQDPAGIQGFRYATRDSVQIWFKPLEGGHWAACFLNSGSQTARLKFNWVKEEVFDRNSHTALSCNKITYRLRNLWLHKTVGSTEDELSVQIPAHDVLLLRLDKVGRD